MIEVYHNPRCRKSREGLEVVEQSGKPFKVIKYLDEPLTSETLTQIIHKLAIKPIELVRSGEKIWKEKYKGKILTDSEIIKAMAENPKLIERPIVILNKKAVIGRPKERINTLLIK